MNSIYHSMTLLTNTDDSVNLFIGYCFNLVLQTILFNKCQPESKTMKQQKKTSKKVVVIMVLLVSGKDNFMPFGLKCYFQHMGVAADFNIKQFKSTICDHFFQQLRLYIHLYYYKCWQTSSSSSLCWCLLATS